MSKEKTEVQSLMRHVEIYHKRPIRTTVDFEALSTVVEHQTSERISASTLKRLWGYVADHRSPRRYTLDVLSKYIGHRDFDHFCQQLESLKLSDSDFFTPYQILSTELDLGAHIELGWSPNRYIILEYCGDSRFRVIESINSKLLAGDEFSASNFMLKYPLYIPSVTRNSTILSSFVGGKRGGLTILSIL